MPVSRMPIGLGCSLSSHVTQSFHFLAGTWFEPDWVQLWHATMVDPPGGHGIVFCFVGVGHGVFCSIQKAESTIADAYCPRC